MKAKVAVICLCYQQAAFVQEALQSVLEQSYPCELIVVDDASKDNSVALIEQFKKAHINSNIKSLYLSENVGNCKAFNLALKMTEADFVIDLAADDMLMQTRVERGVENLTLFPDVAINFTNALYIKASGGHLNNHYPIDSNGKSTIVVPEGDVFGDILESYFICSPTMMYRATFLREVGGYNEDLAYEDFDLKLRLARNHPFSYTDEILVKKRKVLGAMSTQQYLNSNRQLDATYQICKHAATLVHNKREKNALIKRILFEGKQAFIHKRFKLFVAFANLWIKSILK